MRYPGMAATTSLKPIPASSFGSARARHLLIRAGFAPFPDQIRDTAALGLDRAVDRAVRYQQVDAASLAGPDIDPDVIRPPNAEELQLRRTDRDAFRREVLRRLGQDRRMIVQLRQWWLQRMFDTPRPAEESLTLLWHSHFASRHRNVRDTYLMYQQNEFFRTNANGSFADLARGIVRDPAMLKFLNNDRNVARRPNENLSRELMELFTLGEGHYTENDIKQGARALTGYHVSDNDFVFRERQHDDGAKAILGRRGTYDGDDFVELLLRRPQCSRYIAFKLYRHFVADVDDDERHWPRDVRSVIEQLATRLRKSKYELQPVLATLFKSQHFHDPEVVGRKIKSPVQLVVGTVRATGAPTRSAARINRAMAMMGQELFEPPSVAGWDTGRAWINTSTLFVRQNLCTYLITGKDPQRDRWSRASVDYDPMGLLAGVDLQPQPVVDHLVDVLLGEHIPPAQREPLVRFMKDRTSGVTADSVIALLVLITAMPEYQLC